MDYKIVPLSGANNIKIPVLDAYENKKDGGTPPTPVWIIKADAFFESSMHGYESYIPLQGLSMHTNRDSSIMFGATQGMASSSSLRHSEVIIAIENGGHGPKLESCLNENGKIQNITIKRLTEIQKEKRPVQDIKFHGCEIKKIQQEFDRLIIWFNLSKRTNTFFMFDDQGAPRGSVVSEVDYSKNTILS